MNLIEIGHVLNTIHHEHQGKIADYTMEIEMLRRREEEIKKENEELKAKLAETLEVLERR